MENASKNAGEMIGRLQLQYNRGRQAAITNELVDIITGSLPYAYERLHSDGALQVPARSEGVNGRPRTDIEPHVPELARRPANTHSFPFMFRSRSPKPFPRTHSRLCRRTSYVIRCVGRLL
jgi:hypothetical protein